MAGTDDAVGCSAPDDGGFFVASPHWQRTPVGHLAGGKGIAGVLVVVLAAALLHPTPVVAAGVVGNGSAASCTDAALDEALAGGGLATFDCGAGPVTITITSTKTIAADTTIDGGSAITISGGNSVGVFSVNTGVTFTVQNLTIANGNGLAGGGIFNGGFKGEFDIIAGGTLVVTNSTFSGNSAGIGGGIWNRGPLTITNSTFSGNAYTWELSQRFSRRHLCAPTQPSGAISPKYKDRAGTASGVQKIVLKGSNKKKARALLKGKGGGLPDPTLGSLPLPVTVQLVKSDTSVCFGATYDGGDVIKNEPDQFKAKSQQ